MNDVLTELNTTPKYVFGYSCKTIWTDHWVINVLYVVHSSVMSEYRVTSFLLSPVEVVSRSRSDSSPGVDLQLTTRPKSPRFPSSVRKSWPYYPVSFFLPDLLLYPTHVLPGLFVSRMNISLSYSTLRFLIATDSFRILELSILLHEILHL